VAAARTFTATGSLTGQGGNGAGCGVPAYATAVLINLGAIPVSGSSGFVKAYATGTTAPNASVVNWTKAGAISNMVTVPVNTSASFTLRTSAAAHLFGDVAGFYVHPLYATITPTGDVYSGISSGLLSSSRTATGVYVLTFDRNVTHCSVIGSDMIFNGTRDVSADQALLNGSDVKVEVTNSTNTPEDTYFHVSLTC
jgi:hypothetical protein